MKKFIREVPLRILINCTFELMCSPQIPVKIHKTKVHCEPMVYSVHVLFVPGVDVCVQRDCNVCVKLYCLYRVGMYFVPWGLR
jgi:hypothetical protein